ncbi:SDR family oxidoreductase [Flavobacterium sp. j3]|uniref:SDR family oxidoreductase n=1 Tax=Flavobacterium aureirubrum TaxID=3133147 RepID=A0ABU9NAP0_9FLAO
MEQVIVLGATGNIGLAVIKNLQNKNVEVFAGVQSEKDFEKVSQFEAIPLIVNFTDQESLNQALKGKDRVFLVTPLMQNPEAVTQMVINAAKQNGVKHLVRSTASGADSNGQIQMARWAGASEDLIKVSGLNYTIVRPYSFLQNFINFHSQTIKQYNGFYLPTGEAKLSMLDINDLGEVVALALTSDEHFGKTYELSGLTYTNEILAETLSQVLGRKVSYIDIPEEKAKESMLSNHMPEWMVNAMMELNYITKQGWTASYSDDYKKLTGKEYTSAETFFTNNKQAFL